MSTIFVYNEVFGCCGNPGKGMCEVSVGKSGFADPERTVEEFGIYD
jgi:hypothetical protein